MELAMRAVWFAAFLAALLVAGCFGLDDDGGAGEAPVEEDLEIAFIVSNDRPRVTVASAPPDADWNDLRLRLLSGQGVEYALDSSIAASGPVEGNERIIGQPTPILVGDQIRFCAVEEEAEVMLVHLVSNSWVRNFAFTALPRCEGVGDDLGGDTGSAPAISWSVSQANDRATVSSAEGGVLWSHFEVRGSATGAYSVAADAGATDARLPTSFSRIDLSQPLSGGDHISFCRDVAGPLDVELRRIDSGTLVQTFRFTAVMACDE